MTLVDHSNGGPGPHGGSTANGGTPSPSSGGSGETPRVGWTEDTFRRRHDGRGLDERAAVSVRHGGDLVGVDRWVGLLGGGLLMTWGLRRGGLGGLIGLTLGGTLAYAGATGRVPAVARALAATEEETRVASERGWSAAAVTQASTTILKPADALYRLWRDPERLSRILGHVERIEGLGQDRMRWTVHGPAGFRVSFVARITEDEPGRRLAWESEPGADVRNAGWVEFNAAPGERGTEVKALIAYEPPAGQFGRHLARLLREEPGVQLRDDLRRFKQEVETGAAATAETPKPA